MKSILQTERECYITGSTGELHRHHIYHGTGNRQVSEDNGFWVYLTPELHNMSKYGVHYNDDFDLYLKRKCQREYEKTHSRQDFIKLIGRSYL